MSVLVHALTLFATCEEDMCWTSSAKRAVPPE